jgi:hypothetical protein
MTKADDAQSYEQRVQGIQLANQPLLEGFEHWLRQSGFSEPTIKAHVDNMRLFEHYLLLYAYSLRRLDEATEGDVYNFLELIRKPGIGPGLKRLQIDFRISS